jgi:MULE transposase domain
MKRIDLGSSFFHNESLQLLHLFPRSYVLDSTYRTNRFNLPLLDIVGFTATNRSFVIGQAFLTHEEEEDYIWVLRWIKDLYAEHDLPTPGPITTDKAGGIHNACSIVWPEVPHLLCRWHINKDVKAYCQKQWLIQTNRISNQERKSLIDQRFKEFISQWLRLLYAQTEMAYDQALESIENQHSTSQGQIINYLERAWLPFKETFILAWTNKIRHYGHVDSSRAEGVHQAIKRRMGRSQAHLNDIVDHLSRYLDLHNRSIRQELEYNHQKQRTDLQSPLFRKLHGRISYYALDEVERHRRYHKLTLQNPEVSLQPCTQVVTTTTKGLPCAHILQERILQRVPLEIEDFDIQWRVDRLQELTDLPAIRRIVDPLTVRSRFTKSQKRQLSMFEIVQRQVDTLSTGRSKIKNKARAHREWDSVQWERGESSGQHNFTGPIDLNSQDEDLYDSEDDPLGAELARQRHQILPASSQQLQVRGWVHYQPPPVKPDPFREPFSPFPSLPSTPSILRDSPHPPPSLPPLSPPPAEKRPVSVVSPMTSPTKQRPQRAFKRPRRYRDSLTG